MMGYDQVEALSNLLSGAEMDEREAAVNPGRFGPSAPSEKNNPNAGVDPLFKTVIKSGPSAPAPSASSSTAPAKVDTRAIWSADEIEQAKELTEDDVSDGRIKPDYDILYKQSLSAEDVFLNMGLKDGSTQNCEAIVVKIPMPGASMAEVTLEVTPTRLLVRSNQYKLFLYLPHTVNDQAGRAKWDTAKSTLSITLPIIRRDEDEI